MPLDRVDARERGIPPTSRAMFHAVEALGMVMLAISVLYRVATTVPI